MFRFITYISSTLILLTIFVRPLQAQVNVQNGSAVFSLPLFQWQDDKSRLNNSISLMYSSGTGLRVNDLASDIGQGWILMGGGVISRIQAGEPDDQKPRDGGADDLSKYPAGYLYNNVNVKAGCPNVLNRYPLFPNLNTIYKQNNSVAADREMDLFSFQFGGNSGIFFINKITGKGESINDNRIKIWYDINENMQYGNEGIRTTIASFYIQDENGLIYKFQKPGFTKLLKHKYCDPNRQKYRDQPELTSNNVYFESGFNPEPHEQIINPLIINSWYLTEIEDPLTHRKVTLNYEYRTFTSSSGTDIAFYRENLYSIITYKVGVNITPVLTSINFPDAHTVVINYGKNRYDLIGGKAISSIDIKYNGRFISKYALNTTYVISSRYGVPRTDDQQRKARLYLKSIQKIGVDLKSDEPPYVFDYYLGSGSNDDVVPAPYSHLKDIWGFYNGDYSKGSDGLPIPVKKPLGELNHVQIRGLAYYKDGDQLNLMNVKPNYAKNGLIKMITYPTGGFIQYTYEQNTAKLNGFVQTIGGVHVSSTKVIDGGYSNNCDNPIITNYKFITEDLAPSLWGVEMPKNVVSVLNRYEPEYKRLKLKWNSILPELLCEYMYQYPGILSRDQEVHIQVQDWAKVLSLALQLYTIYSDVTMLANVVAGSNPITAIVQVVINWIVGILSTCFNDLSKTSTTTVYYNTDLNMLNPLPQQYKRVEVIQGDGSKGKSVSEFTSIDDYPLWQPDNPNMTLKQRFAPWAYGLPKRTIYFDSAGYKVKELIFKYDTSLARQPIMFDIPIYDSSITLNGSSSFENKFQNNNLSGPAFSETQESLIKSTVSSSDLVSCKCYVKYNESLRFDYWNDWSRPDIYLNTNPAAGYYLSNSNEKMNVEFYSFQKGRMPLMEMYERVYKPNSSSSYLETKTEYRYNNTNLQVSKTKITQSNGDVNQKDIQYNSDFSDGSVLSTLTNNNILNIPVVVTESVIKSGTNVSAGLVKNVTEFGMISNGDIKPKKIFSARTLQPQQSFLWAPYYGTSSNLVAPNFKLTQELNYDIAGNIIGLKDEGGHQVSNIYGYDDKYVIASVINADPISDKSAYTSFESSTNGGWSIIGNNSITSNSFVTGNKSFVLSSTGSQFNPGPNILKATINNTKSYILSFWATSTLQVSSPANLIKSSPTINGFSYYEYIIPAGSSFVTVSGNAIIDELRLYPSTARMRTVSYDPVIGKTSECDENNRIVYYEYDELARLRFIKDEQRNIIKMYEYNYLDRKQNGCDNIFFNNEITEYFIKDCPSGYLGSQVPYIVPAKRYSSSNSQDEADQLAENDLNLYGQEFANTSSTGFCSIIYKNAPITVDFKKANCGIGYIGSTITYSIPEGRYTSIKSQSYVDSLANDEAKSNGQAFANTRPRNYCIIDPTHYLIYDSASRCKVNSYGNTGMVEIRFKDINPNTSSGLYNITQWRDSAINYQSCPINTIPLWQPTGNLRCKLDGIYTTGTQEREEKDNNPNSPSYLTSRWIDNGFNSLACPIVANWVNDGMPTCSKPDNVHNNGVQLQRQVDQNPYSKQAPRTITLPINLAACPITPDWQNDGTTQCIKSGSYNTGELQYRQIDVNPYTGNTGVYQWVSAGINTTACPVPQDWQDVSVSINGQPAQKCEVGTGGYNTGKSFQLQQNKNPFSVNAFATQYRDAGINYSACPVVEDWQNDGVPQCTKPDNIHNNGRQWQQQTDKNPYTKKGTRIVDVGINFGACPIVADWVATGSQSCEVSGVYTTGHLLQQYKDQNPYSTTYGQFNWVDAGVNFAACPVSQDWQDVAISINGQPAQKCELGIGGYNTGKQFQLQQNKNPYSANAFATQYRDAGVNISACPIVANWVNDGAPTCSKPDNVHNNGVQLQRQVDQNPYSKQAPRTITLSINLAACPITPDWQNDGTTQCIKSGSYNTGELQYRQIDVNPYTGNTGVYQWVSAGINTTACPVPQDWQDVSVSINGQHAQKCEVGTGGYNTGKLFQLQQNKNPFSVNAFATQYRDAGINYSACPVVEDWQNDGVPQCTKPDNIHNNGRQWQQQTDKNPYTNNGTRIVDVGVNLGACPVVADWVATGSQSCQVSGIYTTGHLLQQYKDQNPYSSTYGQLNWIDAGVNTAVCPVSPPDWRDANGSIYGQPKLKCETGAGGYNTGHLLQLQIDINPYSISYNGIKYRDAGVNTGCPVIEDWREINSYCDQTSGHTNGYKIVVEKNMNPYSSSANSQRNRTIYDPTACPDATPNWQFSYDYCQQDGNGNYTKYRVDVYVDINPNSATYNSQLPSIIYDPYSCPSSPKWQYVSSYCETDINGLNTGFKISTYQDMNPYSDTYGIRYSNYEYDPVTCPNNSPNWQPVNSYCETTSSGNTGFYITVYMDINGSSSTYGQTYTNSVYNPGNCPPPCIYTCYGEGYKCVNNVCEFGVKKSVGGIYTWGYDPNYGYGMYWFCIFRYEWSDGTQGPDILISNGYGYMCLEEI